MDAPAPELAVAVILRRVAVDGVKHCVRQAREAAADAEFADALRAAEAEVLALVRDAVLAEREACARLAEGYYALEVCEYCAEGVARAIRARG
jgi:hypothetical protein